MKKLLYISGGSVLLLLALVCGVFFASPASASAQSVATTPTATPATPATPAKHSAKKDIDHSLRAFVRNHRDLVVAQIAPQLHLTGAQLTQKLQSGENFAKIAKDQKVSATSLKAILVKSVDTVVAQELKAGKIDQKHATLLTNRVKEHPAVVARVIHHYYHKK